MGSRDFKEMVMCLRTSRAAEIRRYYLAIEDLFKMYCEYTLHFQLRREKRRLGKKQGTIDDLVRGMEEMKLEHKREREEDDRRYKSLINRADGLLQHAEQAEEDRIVMMGDLNAVRRVAAPHPDEPKNVHRMAVVKMSPDYEWVEGDPKYYSEIDAVAIRTQIKYFNGRIKKIQNAGDGTNRNASVRGYELYSTSYFVEVLIALTVSLVPGIVHAGLPVGVGIPAH